MNYNNSTFASATQQKKSKDIATFLLATAVVILIHGALVWFVSRAPEVAPIDNIVIMEVAMIHESNSARKASLAPAAVKKEPVKPKPAVKPKSIKKPLDSQKLAPKPPEIKKAVSVPQVTPTTPPTVSAPSTTPTTAASSTSAAANTAVKTSKDATPGSASNQTVVSSVIPLFRMPPKYPTYAASRHIEGWVKIEFTVQTDGSVENAVVVSSEPEDIFNDAALAAINQWKFKEKIVNGVSVTQRAVQKLQFKLE